ncbi:hypothetical protein AAVH_15134 [Aphelenchoides avenae]|nr:hypothetical protein AAVH_15134 [Aphelenchus avenae]
MNPLIRETIFEGLQQQLHSMYIFASDVLAEVGISLTEAGAEVPLPQVAAPQVHVKQESADAPDVQADVKKEVEEGVACVVDALQDAMGEPSE